MPTVHCSNCGTGQNTMAPAGAQVRCFSCGSAMALRVPRKDAGPGLGQLLIGGALVAGAGYTAFKVLQGAALRMTTYNLFISHAWTYNADYYRLVGLLEADADFTWENHSVPEHDPLMGGTDWWLDFQLQQQVHRAEVMLVISGMYVHHRRWIQREIEMAVDRGIPIIGIKPWGAQVTPLPIREVADEIVGWRTTSIVEAVRRHAA